MAKAHFLWIRKDGKTFHNVIREANTNFILYSLCFLLCSLLFELCSLNFALCSLNFELCSLDLKQKPVVVTTGFCFKSPNTPDPPEHRHPGIYQKSEWFRRASDFGAKISLNPDLRSNHWIKFLRMMEWIQVVNWLLERRPQSHALN